MNKVVIDAERCKGCKLCIEACPKKSLELSIEFNSAGYHTAVFAKGDNCSSCGFCYLVCPEVCIEVYKDEPGKP